MSRRAIRGRKARKTRPVRGGAQPHLYPSKLGTEAVFRERSGKRRLSERVDGFRMAMDEQGVSASLVTRPVPRGCDGAYNIASDLLQSGVDVVIADVTTPVAKLLTPLLAQAKVPLVVANVGGHVPLPADKSPYVLHNSLLYWQASFAAGKWAAGNLGRSAFVAASLADSG